MTGLIIWMLVALLFVAVYAAVNLYRKLVKSEDSEGYWKGLAELRGEDRDNWVKAYTRMDARAAIAENGLRAVLDKRTRNMANIGNRMAAAANAALMRLENERP